MAGLLTLRTRRPPKSERLILSCRNLRIVLGARPIIDDPQLEIRLCEGEVVTLQGPNGAGKSTILNAIMGLVPVARGSIEFQGTSLLGLATHERAQRGVAYMRQRANVFDDLTVRENLVVAVGREGPEVFRQTFREWETSLPEDRRAGLLSGGQRQRLAWAMTVLRRGIDLLLIDEAEAGMDESILDRIPEAAAALVVTHGE